MKESVLQHEPGAGFRRGGAVRASLAAFALQSCDLRGVQDKPRYVLGKHVITGQTVMIYAAPGTGKTLMTLALLVQAIKDRTVDPAKVYYLSFDDDLAGLAYKKKLADKHGFKLLADEFHGLSAKRLPEMLATLDGEEAKGCLLVIDTLKKVVDLMDKTRVSEVNGVLRQFCRRNGATVVALGHTNKHRDVAGRPVYGGTSDVVDDFDCVYMMTAEHEADMTYVTMERLKSRGAVPERSVFEYLSDDALNYGKRLKSVRLLSDDEAADLLMVNATFPVIDLISATTAAISTGHLDRGGLISHLQRKEGVGRKEAGEFLDTFTGPDLTRHHWTRVWDRGRNIYKLLSRKTHQ